MATPSTTLSESFSNVVVHVVAAPSPPPPPPPPPLPPSPPVSQVIASDSYVATLSMSMNGSQKMFVDSRGKTIVVYVAAQSRIAIAVNGDPGIAAWRILPTRSDSGFVRPAPVLVNDDTMHILAEETASGALVDFVVRFTRDASGAILDCSMFVSARLDFQPNYSSSSNGLYPVAVLAHDGSVWAAWCHRSYSGTTPIGSSILVSNLRSAGLGWTGAITVASDITNPERFYCAMIERPDNDRLCIFANRGEASVRTLTYVSATFVNGTWTWGPPNLVYETAFGHGLPDAVNAAWDPIQNAVVVVGPYPTVTSGQHQFNVFQVSVSETKTHVDTPLFPSSNNNWGEIYVDRPTGDYVILWIDPDVGAVNGMIKVSRLHAGAWAPPGTYDATLDNIAFHALSHATFTDFIFARGRTSGSVQIIYARL